MNSKNRERIQLNYFLIFHSSFLFLFAGWTLVAIPSHYQSEVGFQARAIQTSGTITAISRKITCAVYTPCSSNCDVRVEFQNREGRMLGFWASCRSSVSKNQTVPVLYAPDQPDGKSVNARIDTGDSPKHLVRKDLITSLIVALLGSGMLIYALSNSQELR